MNKGKWWMRVVGGLYLMEGVGLTLMALAVPDEFAAMWATAVVGSLDPIAVRGTLVAGMPGVLTWVLLGSMLWLYSRVPVRARLLIITVVAWELLVWLPLDVLAFFNGFEAARAASLITVHVLIGGSGLLALRQLPKAG